MSKLHKYAFSDLNNTYAIDLTKDEITIPVNLLTSETCVTVTVKDGNTENTPVKAKTVTSNVSENGTVVTVVNTFNDITVTGLALNIAPFIAMFAAVGAAIALYIAAKRRVR